MQPLAGVNLRQEDIQPFLDACQQAGVDFRKIPILYEMHDDTEDSTNACIKAVEDAGLWVRIWRCMVNDSRLAPTRIPATDRYGQPSTLQGWNEADDDSAYPNLPGWVDGWWQWVYSLSRGLKIQYGAPNVNGFLTENKALEAALDSVGRHIGSTFSPPPNVIEGKPTCVSEIEIDPRRFTITGGIYPWGSTQDMDTAYGELIDCMKRCIAAGEDCYVWGIQNGDQSAGSPVSAPDAAYCPQVLEAIIQINQPSAEAQAEDAYNKITNGGMPFIPNNRYVQNNNDGTFTVVVTFPLK